MSVAYPPAPAYPRRGHHGSRMGRPLLLGVFGGLLAVILLIALFAVNSSAPPAEKAQCPGGPCGNPPTRPPAPQGAPALISGQIFKSTGLGYQFEFNQFASRFRWKIESRDADSVVLSLNGGAALLAIDGQKASVTPQEALDQAINKANDRIPDLAADTDPKTEILVPSVGFRRGVGQLFGGTFQTPQGAGVAVVAVIMAASDGKATVSVTALTPEGNRELVFNLVDSLMNTFRFPTEDGS
jgi:hypothetical protein